MSRERGELRWFAVALLLALASALVPALVHSGPPATRLIGSAFDPATSSVALRGRAQMPVRAQSRLDGTPGAAPRQGLPFAAAPVATLAAGPAEALAGPALAYPFGSAHRTPRFPDRPGRLTDARPRAPPLRAL